MERGFAAARTTDRAVTPYLRIGRSTILQMTDLERAWAELDSANVGRWVVGRPSLHDEVRGAEHWQQWAYDPREKPRAGKRTRTRTATALTEVECVREMARWLRDVSARAAPATVAE